METTEEPGPQRLARLAGAFYLLVINAGVDRPVWAERARRAAADGNPASAAG